VALPSTHLERLLPLFLWISLLGGGFWQLFVYSNTPGAQAQASHQWPGDSGLSRNPASPTLVLFAHPHCPCSQASIGELERLMPHIKDKVKSYVVFFKPRTQSEAWVKEILWEKARSIPGVQVVLDEDGIEARRFDAQTSGQTLLYDENGTLAFRGGITPGRGHMGDNEGRSAILSFVETGKTGVSTTPVFGCSLRNPERALAGDIK